MWGLRSRRIDIREEKKGRMGMKRRREKRKIGRVGGGRLERKRMGRDGWELEE